MLGNKKNQKKTVFGGIGVALLLCALMVLMPMSGYVDNNETEATVQSVEADSTGAEEYYALPEKIAEAEYEYDPSLELQGMRDAKTKSFLNEDGSITQMVASEPIHYMSADGTWENIDLNIQAYPEGWGVTENTFTTYFAPEVAGGVMVQANEFVDPVVSGINPMLVTLDATGTAPEPFIAAPSPNSVDVGGNVIRYPLAEGFDLDYEVESNQVKQNLILREVPVIPEAAEYFGISEGIRMPAGYALFSGETMVGEEVFKTQEDLQIRNIETGELLVEIPAPVILEANAAEPYTGTFFVQVHGPDIILITVVESDWLLDEDRQYPVVIDPSIRVNSASGGYCYIYYANCYTSTYRRHYRYYGSYYYIPWHKYTFTSSSALPSGATVEKIEFKKYMNYAYGQTRTFQVKVLENCGLAPRYSYSMGTGSCSGSSIAASYLATNYGGTQGRSLKASIGLSPSAATVSSSGTGWKTVNFCNSATACAASSGGVSIINNALTNQGTVGVGEYYTGGSAYFSTYGIASGSRNSHLLITYSGGTDADAPTSDFVPYTGIDSYIEGERTLFIKLTDMSGIDTTSSGAPQLFYSTNGGTSWSSTSYGLGSNNQFDAGELVSIGTCSSSATDCKFKARVDDLSYGDDFQYYWKYQDLNQGSNGANVGYTPALTGTQTTPTPYQVDIVDPANAPTSHKKMTVLTTDVHAGSYFNPQGFFDRQMTYYSHSDEYFFEFDTSSCGTGSSSCFYTSTSTFYGNWIARGNTAPAYGYYGMNSGSNKFNQNLWHNNGDGYLQIAAKDGPGMNLIFVYNSAMNQWATVGVDTETGIDAALTGGSQATASLSYGYTQAYKFAIPGDITGSFGTFSFNATQTTTTANRLCVTTNGWYYFYRSISTDRCTSAYYMIYGSTSSYRWSGFALGSGYYGRQASTGDITYKVGNVAPTPDTFAPEMIHTEMQDSHSKSRTVSVTILDAGDPAAGLNTSTSAGTGPTLYHRITPDGGTAGSWVPTVMDSDKPNRADCALSACTWSATIEDLEVNDTVEYYFTSQDVSTVSSGVNTNTSFGEGYSFKRGDPNKVFVVEWRDMAYYTYGQLCTVQALFYDVTNEIEYKYDSGCRTTYNSWSIGYMDQTRQKGASIAHSASTSFNSGTGHIPTTSNFRISTSSTSHAWEAFDKGLVEVTNADTAMTGTSNGRPYLYYCISSYYWNTYKARCNANIDIPAGFEFDYFGTTYDGDDANDRVQLSRQGSMYFISNGNTNVERNLWTYHQPALPYTGSSLARPGTIAPFWTGYNQYYCYVNSNQDCSVYYRVMPYEGKGTDVTADITSDPVWDLTDSPIRINPSNDYLVVSSDLTIKPGVEIYVAQGKGISFDGACTQMSAEGTEEQPINITGLNGAEWVGMAFTDDCTTTGGTDDRHVFSHVNFKNTSDAVFRSGSRHDNTGPSCGSTTADCNTGNYTMNDVTFTNVGAVFTHGSGQGTVITMEDFSVDGADEACFNFPENTVATLKEGTLKNCNTDGKTWAGAIVNYPGSTAGALHAENLTVENSYVNFIDVDLQHVTVSNVTVTNPSAQSGVGIDAMYGTNSNVVINNVDVDSYANSGINAMGSISMTDVDFGSADLWLIPGGWSQTGNGPSGSDAVFDTITAGDITMQRIHPGTFADITAEDVSMSGSSIVNEVVEMTNFDIDSFTIAGCGWAMEMHDATMDSFKSTCSSSSAKNSITIADADMTHGSSSDHVFDGRNSHIAVGETSITSTGVSSGSTEVAKARSGTNIVLIDVDLNGNDCSDSNGDTGNCAYDVSSSSSNPSMVYFGGLANVSVYRLAQSQKVYKADHVVTASLLDSSMNELFQVGSHITDANGNTDVWVVVEDSDGTTYEDHVVRAFGTAGQNETYPDDYPDATLASSWYPSGGYTWGTHLDLLLEPAPIVFNDPTLNCNKLINDQTYANLSGNFNSGTNTFTFDDTSITVAADLMLDTCGFELQGGSLRVLSTATSSPVITIKDTGFLTANNDGTSGSPAAIRAVSSTYGLTLDIQNGGTLTLDHANLRDLAWDTTTESGLFVGMGATLNMLDSATVFGASASSDDMATVKVMGGSANIDSSSIINTGQTGTAIWIENSGATLSDIIVKNAAVGIQSYNGAPQVDGFTSTGNTVGVNAYGGMSLPTIYRSSSLSGMSAGWNTYKIDLSSYLGTGDYLQVGANSIWAGGNAHPTYNYFSSKYYFITDRMNIMLEDNNGNSWNITDSGQEGYYPYGSNDPAVTAGTHTYNGGNGGAPSWHCNYYGYAYGPNYAGSYEGWYYYFYRYWLGQTSVGWPDYYDKPDEFGFSWEGTENSPSSGFGARYPYTYWGYYSPSSMFSGIYSPPEGANGQPSSGPGQPGNAGNPPSYASSGYPNNYGVCLDYAYTYYMNSGQGARKTFPIVDISAAEANGGNISKVYLWMDVMHKGADNYQDRYDFVARTGNDPSDLGNYQRESGTPLFKEGTITGATTGIEVGGGFAAGHFEDIDVVGPTQSGLEVVGQTSASADRINVSNGNYGVLISTTASGGMDLENLDLDNQVVAGIYYQNDLGGEISGAITGSTGAAFKYGTRTDSDVSFSNMNIENNAIGIEAAGSGPFTLTDVTMSNTKDVVITGTSTMDFIEGSIDTSSVEVTGSGEFSRLRQLDITLQANVSGVAEDVEDTTVVLKDASGAVTGMAETDSNGVANDITFVTQTIDNGACSSICTKNLNGYEVVASATIEYFWSGSSNNAADFRYVFETVSLTDTSGNSDTVYMEDEFTARICYTSTAYTKQERCASGLGSTSSRTYTNGLVEYGYLRSHGGNDLAGETVMMDAPFMYLRQGTHNWNASTWIITASYDFENSNRMYPYFSGESYLYWHDADVTTVTVNSDGAAQGFQLGYRFYSLNIDMNNTTISGLSTINAAMGYGYRSGYELDFYRVTNSTFVHYQGYDAINNNAISSTDVCMNINGGDGNVISDNTFIDCAVGVSASRSPYYYSHASSEIGADNITITDNVFLNGGELTDVWLESNNEVQGAVITGNEFNPSQGANTNTGGHAVLIYNGNTRDVLIEDNVVVGGDDAFYLRNVDNFEIKDNTIGGIGDPTSTGIDISRGSGNVTDNTLIDADGGIYLDSMEAPPAPSSTLCSIASSDYRRGPYSCTWTVAAGKSIDVNLGTDSWGYEISITILKPDGTTDSWPTYSFASNTQYSPLRSYSDAGSYTLTVRDSFGDGGATINVVETSAAGNYDGPVVSGNTIGLSAGRTSPNAVGITATDCDGVAIQSASNTIDLGDNAIIIENCDYNDVGSVLTGDSLSSTVGILADDTNSDLTLNGTEVSGYATGVSKENGVLFMIGDAEIAGTDYGVYAEDTYVYALVAHVDGGATGTGLHVVDSPDAWVYPMDASGAIGMYVENTPFRWDGGVSDATTALSVVDAIGTVENLTWSDSTTQMNAGNNAHITSIGNTLDASKLVVASSAVIDEANLMSIDSTHLGAAPSSEVALLLTSTDDERASYVSTSFQPEAMSVDGSDEDWNGGNALNPSGYAMPGMMSGDGTDDFLVTYIEGDGIYFGMTNTDLSNSDVLIYLSTGSGGSDVGYNGLGGAHDLPISANYVIWADSEGSYDLYSYGFLGWSPSSLSTANVDVDFSTSLAEIGLPWSRIGGMPDEIDIVAIVQAETTADISVVHPTQTLDSSATLQDLTKFMTVELTHGDLADGTLSDEVLVYQSYKGSTTATGQKNYDLMIKTPADCAYDWAVVEDISMATNVVFDDSYVAGTGDTTDVRSTLDIKRACPVIDTTGTDTDDGLVDFSRDEDSGAFTFSLTNLADDVQDEETDLTWVVDEGALVAFDNILVDWSQNGQDVTITPLNDQFGYMVFSFEVTDSNGLSDSHNITYTVENVNDAPQICNQDRVDIDCMPVLSEDDGNLNILPEGFGTHTKFLGDVSNASRSYIRDNANEQSPTRQVYSWSADAVDFGTTDACSAFSVSIVNNELVITENTANELGGKCTITLDLADDGGECVNSVLGTASSDTKASCEAYMYLENANWGGSVFTGCYNMVTHVFNPALSKAVCEGYSWSPENADADSFDVVFSVAPVNDAPVILDWNRTTETVMVADNGSIPALPWSLSLMEDDENAANLTYDLSAIKADIDHELDDLTWTVESTDQCVYTNYFTTTIVGDDLVFDLIEDATTNANDWEIDYLNNNGIHQIGPSGSEYCQIRLVLRDTPTAPITEGQYNTYVPNYDPSVMAIADYQQGVATKEIGVRVENVREQVPDYFFDAEQGFNFNGVQNVMTGTYVPVTVAVEGGGDEGPYRYDHMLAITYHTDGHDDVELTRYYNVPDYGSSVKFTEDVYITQDTTHVWIEMDVVTCLANPCDMSVTAADRFQADDPASHYAIVNNEQSEERWSKPGQYGKNSAKTSERRPLLEDSNWCNNIMTSLATADVCNHANQPASNFLSTDQKLPVVVETIGASAVPSFAPSIVAVALTGLFVSALSFASRRADDEEEVESMAEDDAAVSPVIATILMVAITVVLSGVIYVWASSLAETDVKGVPRVTFDIEDVNGFDADEGHWRISVEQTQTPLATQAVEVKVFYTNATGALNTHIVNLADSAGVYGFNPANSDAFVTFVDQVTKDDTSDRTISTFNAGDTIFVRTHAPDGTPLEDATITLSYAPLNGDGALLRTWDDLSYDQKA